MKIMKTKALLLTLLALAVVAIHAKAQEGEPPPQILFKDANVFDGKREELITNVDVLVVGNLIKGVGKELAVSNGTTIIDAGGRTLMPGLLDAHVHLMINDAPHISIYEDTWGYVGAASVAGAKAMLLRGFTSVRDVGGPVAGLKRAIDEGLVEGPRILPSGPFISQTSGHADLETSKHKFSPYFTGIPDKTEIFGWGIIADGVPEVQKAEYVPVAVETR